MKREYRLCVHGAILLCSLVAYIWASPAQAAPAIHLGGWSTHIFHSDDRFTSSHKILIFEVEPFLVGRFTNSYGRTTLLAAYGTHQYVGNFRFSLYTGVVYGYRGCLEDSQPNPTLCPMLVPAVTYTKYRVQPSLSLIGEAAVFSLRFPF